MVQVNNYASGPCGKVTNTMVTHSSYVARVSDASSVPQDGFGNYLGLDITVCGLRCGRLRVDIHGCEREREICVYVCIYVYMYICMCIYIYIYEGRLRADTMSA